MFRNYHTYTRNQPSMLLLVFSAYCGGLWLASLRTMSEIAKVLGYPEDIKKYNNILQRGKKAYERKLWNGNGAYYSVLAQ